VCEGDSASEMAAGVKAFKVRQRRLASSVLMRVLGRTQDEATYFVRRLTLDLSLMH